MNGQLRMYPGNSKSVITVDICSRIISPVFACSGATSVSVMCDEMMQRSEQKLDKRVTNSSDNKQKHPTIQLITKTHTLIHSEKGKESNVNVLLANGSDSL